MTLAFQIQFDEPHGLVFVNHAGEIDLQETLAVARELEAHPRFGPGWAGLSDVVGTTIDLDPDEIDALAAHVQGLGTLHGVRWAFVSDPQQDPSVMQLYQATSARIHEVRIFHRRDEALRWLTSHASCEFRWLPGPRVLLERMLGTVDLPAIFDMKARETAAEITDPGIRGISDLRGARLDLSHDDIVRFVEWMKSEGGHLLGSRWSLLVSDPKGTGLVMMYADMVKDVKQSRVFSTFESALEWVGLTRDDLGDDLAFFGEQ